MVVMQVDPSGQSDPKLVALAATAQTAIKELLAYVDVIPPRLNMAKIRDLRQMDALLRLQG